MPDEPERRGAPQRPGELAHGAVDVAVALAGDFIPDKPHGQELIPACLPHQGGECPPQVVSLGVNFGPAEEAAHQLRHAVFSQRLGTPLADSPT
ncbi:MAG TPA: hypothetical protein VJ377_08750, partial [Dehalococcoidales bacterium]|nr:hypothetical protein [Dehalococcoidales bacterium]